MLQGLILGLIEMLVITGIYIKYDIVSVKESENGKQWVLMAIIGILTVYLDILLFKQSYRINTTLNIVVVYTILAILAGIDLKKKVIPNSILRVGFIIKIILLLYEWIMFPDTIQVSFFRSVSGFVFGLLFLLILSFITRHGIGYGDVKMFAWLGFCVGLMDTYNILFYSVLAAAAAGIYLLLVKRAERKKQLPFAPFVYIGCYLVFCMTFLGR